MDVVIKLDGLAIGIPKTGLGVNAISASYIQVNSAPNQPLRTYGEEIISRKDIKVSGAQLAATNVRGRARLMPH